MDQYARQRIARLEENLTKVWERLGMVETIVYDIEEDLAGDGDLDVIEKLPPLDPGDLPPFPIPSEPLWEQITNDLTDKQRAALKAAGLDTVKALQEEAEEEDGFIRIDGLGPAADKKLRTALEDIKHG